jgi:hypothetical protein
MWARLCVCVVCVRVRLNARMIGYAARASNSMPYRRTAINAGTQGQGQGHESTDQGVEGRAPAFQLRRGHLLHRGQISLSM